MAGRILLDVSRSARGRRALAHRVAGALVAHSDASCAGEGVAADSKAGDERGKPWRARGRRAVGLLGSSAMVAAQNRRLPKLMASAAAAMKSDNKVTNPKH